MSNNTIPSFNYREISHEQLRSLCTRVSESWRRIEAKPTVVKLALDGLEESMLMHLRVMYRESGSDYTEITKEADDNRDKAYGLFARKVFTATDEFDKNVVNAAEEVYAVLKEVGSGLAHMSYSEQTERTKQLVSLLSTEENLAHIETLGLTDDFKRVEELNLVFEEKWNLKVIDEADDEQLPPLKKVRGSMESDLRMLLNATEFLFNKEYEAVDETLFNSVSTHVSEVVALIKARKTLGIS